VIDVLRQGDRARRASAERALGLASAPWVDDALRAVLGDATPAAQAAALSALAFRRASPRAALSGLGLGDDPALLVAALRSAARWPDKASRPLAIECLSAADAAVHHEAIAAGIVLGIPDAWTACQKLVRGADDTTFAGEEPLPLLFAATLGDPGAVEPLARGAAAFALRRGAVWALGYSGRVSAAEACLPLLDDPNVGRLAAEAFTAITGLPRDERFFAPAPAEAEEPIPLAKEDLDADLTPAPTDDLPRCDRAAVEAWWAAHRSRFERGRRYLAGVPWGRESVLSMLAQGPMRRRRGIALELAARTRGRIQVETGALTARQRGEVAVAGTIGAGDIERPFG
jgi:uncharacterized protein (TIGR02270 family)